MERDKSQEILRTLVSRLILSAGKSEESKMVPTFPAWMKGRTLRPLISQSDQRRRRNRFWKKVMRSIWDL